jgi:hypothetical protein
MVPRAGREAGAVRAARASRSAQRHASAAAVREILEDDDGPVLLHGDEVEIAVVVEVASGERTQAEGDTPGTFLLGLESALGEELDEPLPGPAEKEPRRLRVAVGGGRRALRPAGRCARWR